MIWLADAVLVVHALLALFIVCGLVAIWTGAGVGWDWIRDRFFRLAHLLAIAIVATLSLLGIACPLTVLEDWLRTGSPDTQGFIQRWVSRLLYYDPARDAPQRKPATPERQESIAAQIVRNSI